MRRIKTQSLSLCRAAVCAFVVNSNFELLPTTSLVFLTKDQLENDNLSHLEAPLIPET